MSRNFNKMLSLFLAIVMVLTMLPLNLLPEIKAVEPDVNNDNWQISTTLRETTNGNQIIDSIDWNSTTKEERTFTLTIEYENQVPQYTYNKGDISIEIDSIFDNMRDCELFVENHTITSNPKNGYEAEYSIDANKSGDSVKDKTWSYSVETTGKTYFNVPTKFILTNNNVMEEGTSIHGTVQLSFTLNSNQMKNNGTGEYNIVFKTNQGTTITQKAFDYSFSSTKTPYTQNIETAKIRSLSGFPEGAENYVWVKYDIGYSIDSIGGVREANDKNLKISVPSNALVYDEELIPMTIGNDSLYDIGDYIERYHTKTLLEDDLESTKIFYVAFPKENDVSVQKVSITSYIYGTYMDETSEEIVSTQTTTLNASDFVLDYDGELLIIGKQALKRSVSSNEVTAGTGSIADFRLTFAAKYKSEIGALNIIGGDDVLYGESTNGELYKLSDSEYEFTYFDGSYLKGENGRGLRTLGAKTDISSKYNVEVYVRYRNQSTYNLWKTGKFTADDLGQKVTLPNNVVGIKFKILNSNSEDIELNVDLGVNLHSSNLAKDATVYNFNYLQAEKIDGTKIMLDITEDNYKSFAAKELLMAYDRATYNSLMFRMVGSVSLTDVTAFMSIGKDIVLNSEAVNSDSEKITFTYSSMISTSVMMSNTNPSEFKGFEYYDLLPEGMDLEDSEETIKSNIKKNVKNTARFFIKTGNYLSSKDRNNFLEDAITVTITKNYNNTGRTLLKVVFDCSDNPLDLTKTKDQMFNVEGYDKTKIWTIPFLDVQFKCSISFDNWYEYGKTYTNIAYLTNLSDTPSDYSIIFNKYTYNTTGITGASRDDGRVDKNLIDINGNGNLTEFIGYAKSIESINVAMSTYTDITKFVSVNGTDFVKSATIGYDSDYRYRIRTRLGMENQATNLKIFDSVEAISTGWKGTIKGFDTSWAEEKGYTVKIYISTQDKFSDTEAYTTDLTNSFWQEYTDGTSLTNVKHVAFEFLENGSPAVFNKGELMYVDILMRSTSLIRNKTTRTTSNNCRFTIDEIATSNGAGTSADAIDVDMISNTVTLSVPTALIVFQKTIPTDATNYNLMGLDPNGTYSFDIRIKDASTNAVVYSTENNDNPITAKVNPDRTISRTKLNLYNLDVNKTYIVEEVLPSGSCFELNRIERGTGDSMNVSKVGNNYQFTIGKNIDSSEVINIVNDVSLKPVTLSVQKEVTGEDGVYTSHGWNKNDTFTFNLKLTNKNNPADVHTATVTNKQAATFTGLYPGTYILEETGLDSFWVMNSISQISAVSGITLNKVNDKYEITIANTVAKNQTYSVKVSNELIAQTTGITIRKAINGSAEDFEKIGLDPNGEYKFSISLKGTVDNKQYNINGIISNKSDLVINDLPVGSYIIEEGNSMFFEFVNMTATGTNTNITFTKQGDNYILTVGPNLTGNENVVITVTNTPIPDTYYNEEDSKTNLFAIQELE